MVALIRAEIERKFFELVKVNKRTINCRSDCAWATPEKKKEKSVRDEPTRTATVGENLSLGLRSEPHKGVNPSCSHDPRCHLASWDAPKWDYTSTTRAHTHRVGDRVRWRGTETNLTLTTPSKVNLSLIVHYCRMIGFFSAFLLSCRAGHRRTNKSSRGSGALIEISWEPGEAASNLLIWAFSRCYLSGTIGGLRNHKAT